MGTQNNLGRRDKNDMWQRIRAFLFENKTAKQTVAKNSFWLTVSNMGGRLIKAGIVIYGARVLGTAGWGVFSYAITLTGFLTLFMDPGINNIIMRDTAKSDDEYRRRVFSTSLVVKIVLVLCGVAIIVFLAPHFSTLPGANAILPIVAIVLALDTIREFLTSLVRGKEKMEFDAAIFLSTNLGILTSGFLFLTLVKAPSSLAWAYVTGDVVGIALAAFIVRSYFRKLPSYFSPSLIAPILRSAWPFAVAGALGLLLTNTDILIISWMRTASDVGIYSSAIRVIQLLYIIPMVLQFSTLPVFSRLAKIDNERFRGAFERTLGLVFLASVPLSFGGAIVGTEIITLLFGDAYAAGGLSFRILMVSMIVDFSTVVVSSAIFAYDRQKSLIRTSIIAGLVNVVADLILIPTFGIAGSAVATLIAQCASNWYLWRTMQKINHFEMFSKLKKTFAAGIIMGVFTATLYFMHVNVILNVVVSAIVYFGILRVLREPLLIEIKRLVFGTGEVATVPGQ